jgi:predicted SprT family Zn-dependent metalloprotease
MDHNSGILLMSTLLNRLKAKTATAQGIPAHKLVSSDTTAQRIAQIEALAKKLMNKYWLLDAGWTFSWHNRMDHLGTCYYVSKRIQLSKKWTLAQLEQDAISGSTRGIDKITDTIKHEIAHALAPRGSKHGPAWVAMCAVTGANPHKIAQNLSVSRKDIQQIVYKMVDTTTGDTVKNYYRKPSAKLFRTIHTWYMKGRKEETQGKLILVPVVPEVPTSSNLLDV